MGDKLPCGKYIFEWGGLMENAGGMTRAMLKRANVFISEDIRPTILLSGRGLEQYDRVKHYQNNGYQLIQESDFLCLEDYFGSNLMNDAFKHPIGQLAELEMLPREEKDGFTIYYKEGDMFARRQIFSDRFCIINIFDEYGKCKYIEHYWNNNLRRRIYTEKDDKKIEKFYAENGFCFLVYENLYEKEKWTVKNVLLLDENNKSVKHFQSIDEFRQFFSVSM